MNLRFLQAFGILLAPLLIAASSPARADFKADSLALFGSWRWERSYGGLLGANETPPRSGWSRVLYLRRDGTYAYWEEDSVANFLLCSGLFTVHPATRSRIEGGPPAPLWVDLQGWWWRLDERQLIAFIDSNTILTYPGSEGMGVSDALKHRFTREINRPTPADGDSPRGAPVYRIRPPRLLTGIAGSYYAELLPQWREVRWSAGPLYEWSDGKYPRSLRDSYEYTHYQIPSAVIGDFDGDSTADTAIYGGTDGWRRSRIVCFLSNRGAPRAVVVLEEPTILDPPATPDTTVSTWREPHPALYLTLWRAGRPFEDSTGNTPSLRTEAIAATRLDGGTKVFYLERDRFWEGRSPAVSR